MTGHTVTDLRDGDRPNAGVPLAGDEPSERAAKAATGGRERKRGQAASSGSGSDGAPSQQGPASDSASNRSGLGPGGRRRRRRRKSARKSDTGPAASSSAEAGGCAAEGGPAGSGPRGGSAGEGCEERGHGQRKRRRRRGKSGREIQGRPLTPQKVPHERPAGAAPAEASVQAAGPSRASSHANAASAPAQAPVAHARRQADDLYAALDLGTNNCRLLIAQPTRPGQFRVVDAFSRIVRLGEGLDAAGRLSDEAMDRAVEALKICAGKLKNRPVRRHRLIATEACRQASNGLAFLERVEAETGLRLEVVTRETEARLAVAGCSSLVGRDTDGLVLFDIGGGSSEIAMIDLTENRSNRLADHIKAWTSLPVGVVTLSERHGGCLVTPEVFAAMVEEVDAMLARFSPPDLPAFSGRGNRRIHLLGTSGTVTTLAGLHLDLPRYDRRKVDGLWLSNGEVDRMLDRLLSWDFEARAANPCIGADRADLVLAGCAILQSIRKRWPSERMRVADRGLREGLLNEMMASDGAWRRAGRNYRFRTQRQTAGDQP
ncbi:Ppx/GppA phosphatase family protein [Hoeflea olei]|uniref:Exopolyphosphatase n=1 Tax=Hoeflea olei TaxID=1480615 RepID=A0A1C1YUR7_9HYPH|nr:Ppx/GppA phosphatase family protein [Hoeflea olei]OCW57185.1 exopolyphosphatase [Hoeflea olei]